MTKADPKLLQAARAAHDALTKLYPLARHNPALFAQLVLKDEVTHQGIKLAPMHRAWHALATQHDRLIVWAHNRAGKTQQMAIARTLWEIGRNPGIRVLIVSSTHDRAALILNSIAQYIKASPEYRGIFPGIRPAEPWNSSSLTVERPLGIKDPTVRALGAGGEILGARADLLILDDVLTLANTMTADLRTHLWTWYQNTMVGRLTDDAKVLCIGTAYYPDDLMHKLAASGVYKAVRYPIVDDVGQPRWPERFDTAAIERVRAEMGSFEFARNMLCVARDDSSSVFKQAWIDVCLHAGRDKEMAYGLERVPQGCATYTGVDLAVQSHAAADLTVLTTIVVHPNGRKEVLWIDAGRGWHGPDIVARIQDHHRRYHSLVMVENNAAQEFIAQYARASGVPTKGYTTGRNKVHPEYGVEHLATEMETGQWIFPCRGGISRELNALIGELLQYSPKEHTGDRIMSLWLAREASRLGSIRAEVGRLDLLSR